MRKKYIVELDDNKLAYTAIIIDGVPYIKPLQLLPYTEPDTSEVYQQGLEDARNRKATCEFCEYAGNDKSNEPCVSCCCGYMNRFRPKREPKQIEFGDELRSKNDPNIRVCVTNAKGGKWDGIAISEVIDSCRFGSSYTDRNLDGWEKTGRNFASTLQEMMNEKF